MIRILIAVALVILVAAGGYFWNEMRLPEYRAAKTLGPAYAETIEQDWSRAWQSAVTLQQDVVNYVQSPDDRRKNALEAGWRETAGLVYGALWHRGLLGELSAARRLAMWPVDEGEIDYVDFERYEPHPDNPFAEVMYVRNEAVITGGIVQRLKPLKPEYLRRFADVEGVPGHAPVGLHAMEFLIWGQRRSADAGGQRPHSDYLRSEEACTTDPRAKDKLRECLRRIEAIQTLATILREDLRDITIQWATGGETLRQELEDSPEVGLARLVDAWQQRIRENVLAALDVSSVTAMPFEFSGSTADYLRLQRQGLERLWRAPGDGGLAAWAAHRAPEIAGRIDAGLASLAKLEARASGPEAWLDGAKLAGQAREAWSQLAEQLVSLKARLADAEREHRGSGTARGRLNATGQAISS